MTSSAQLYESFGGDVRELLSCARHNEQLIVVAHLGGVGPGRAENSISSMRPLASEAPLIFEVDIRSSQDGVDFLMHDSDLDRTTTGTGKAAQTNWREIAKLNLKDSHSTDTEFHPDTFDSLLDWAQGRAFLMLDLKSPSSIESLVARLEARSMLAATIFIAYDAQQFEQVRRLAPSVLVALGANDEIQLNAILSEPPSSVVALAGDLRTNPEIFEGLSTHGHFVLAGTYLDPDAIDDQVVRGGAVSGLDRAGTNGVQLLVSNRPVEVSHYLADKRLHVQSSSCVTPEN